MTNIIHISLDLETWGTTPGSDLRSIGACVFDPHNGMVHVDGPMTFYEATDNPGLTEDRAFIETVIGGELVRAQDAAYPHFDGVDHWRLFPLTRDPRTVQWWQDQSPEAQAAFENPTRLDVALMMFTDWLDSVTDQTTNVRIWSHGANFDPGIISAAYRACGITDPIYCRSPRDTRTIFEAADMDPTTCLEAFQGDGIYHHALDDAITQARAICAAQGVINRWKNDSHLLSSPY